MATTPGTNTMMETTSVRGLLPGDYARVTGNGLPVRRGGHRRLGNRISKIPGGRFPGEWGRRKRWAMIRDNRLYYGIVLGFYPTRCSSPRGHLMTRGDFTPKDPTKENPRTPDSKKGEINAQMTSTRHRNNKDTSQSGPCWAAHYSESNHRPWGSRTGPGPSRSPRTVMALGPVFKPPARTAHPE